MLIRLHPNVAAQSAELFAYNAYFILVQQLYRFYEFKLEVVGQTAHIVMGLDRAGFDYVGIYRSLGQETDAVKFAGFFLKYADELGSDDFPFLLGVGDTRKLVEETVCCIDINQIGFELVTEDAHHLLGFALSKETVIDVDGNQLLTYSLDQ